MKKLLGILFLTATIFPGCKDDCNPGLLPENEIIYINILNPGGGSFIKYPTNSLPDSVKVLNIGTNTLTNRSLVYDSILVIENYDKANNAITTFKISKGTILKPDTVQITISQKLIEDKCGSEYSVARVSQIKVNNVVKCTNCLYNAITTIQR